VVANLEYRDHRISVSVIYDTPSQYQFTPVVEIRRAGSTQALNTIMTHEAFMTDQSAIEFGFILGREWIDKRLAEPSR
jgi:hypothetical protein